MIFEEILAYVEKYNRVPITDALGISISQRTDIFPEEFNDIESLLTTIDQDKSVTDLDWLNDATEKFCQERALHNAVLESIHIMDGKSKHDKGMIPKLLTDALGVTFDPNVGHDYLADADARFDFYHRKAKKLPFDLDYFNRITNGGLEPKTLSIIMSGTNVGKTLIMCHFAAAWLAQHFNVLYITMEMAEEKISQRIDANLLDVTLDDLMALPKEVFDRKINRLREKVKGKLIVKEYPTACAGTNHFRALLNELHMKKQFKPDVIIVDYINICTSSRIKMGGSVNSYTLIKSIAEELRGLAVEFKVPIVSATQTTRSGYSSSDLGLDDTSESFGLPATADEFWAATTSEDLAKMGHLAIKRLKSRSGDVNKYKRFVIGINYEKMKLTDVAEKDQHLFDSGQPEPDQPKSSGKYDKLKALNSFN